MFLAARRAGPLRIGPDADPGLVRGGAGVPGGFREEERSDWGRIERGGGHGLAEAAKEAQKVQEGEANFGGGWLAGAIPGGWFAGREVFLRLTHGDRSVAAPSGA